MQGGLALALTGTGPFFISAKFNQDAACVKLIACDLVKQKEHKGAYERKSAEIERSRTRGTLCGSFTISISSLNIIEWIFKVKAHLSRSKG